VFVDEPINQFQLKKDANLSDEIQTLRFKNAFIWCLINAYKIFHVDKKRQDIKPAGLEVAFSAIVGDDGDDLITKFLKDYKVTNVTTDFIRASEVEEWLKGSQISSKKFGVEMKKYAILKNLENVISDVKHIGKSVRVWRGLRRLVEEADEADE